jgi:hypothetical protein
MVKIEALGNLLQAQCITSLLDRIETDWGDPEENKLRVVRTGIPTVDNLVYGFEEGLTGIIGASGSRKSTFIANAVLYNSVSKKIQDRIPQVIFTAESGMRPGRYRDMLIAMRATQYLRHWQNIEGLPGETPNYLFTDFFRFYKPNETQSHAIQLAIHDLSNAPLYIIGSGQEGGVDSIANYHELFKTIAGEIGYAAVYIDHLHSIYTPNAFGDYEVINAIVPVLANVVKLYNFPVVAAAQVSAGSQRIKLEEARGGTRLREECSLYFKVRYKRLPYHCIELFVDKSRKSNDQITIEVPIEHHSGLVISDGVVTSEATEGPKEELFEYNEGLFAQ